MAEVTGMSPARIAQEIANTSSIGNTNNAGLLASLDTQGKLQVLTDQVTREQDAASKGYVDAQNPYKPWIVNGSLDDYIGNGVYPVADTSVANRPENAYGTLVVTQPTGGRFMQEFTTYTTPVRRYVRTKHASNDYWSAWSRIDSTETLVTSGDLNDLVEVGTYRIASTSVGNRPENRYGSLEVLSPTEMRTIQRFTIFHGDEPPTTHLRSLVHATGEWTEWAGGLYNSAVVDGDLDSFTNQGVFPIANLGIGNLPVDKYGTLEVMYPTRSRYIQRYTTFEVPTRQYTRTKYASDDDWSEWRETIPYTKEPVTSGSLDDVTTPGVYPVSNTAVTERPSVYYGSLEVTIPTSGRVIQKYTDIATPPSEFVRIKTGANPWSAWEKAGAYKSAVTSGSLNDILTSGIYPVSHTDVTDRPSVYYGTLEVIEPTGGRVIQKYTDVNTPPVEYIRVKNGINNDFSEWSRTGAGAVANPDDFDPNVSRAATRKAMMVQELTARKGGRIGTGGLGAVALRFDDYHAEFVEHALPLLKELRLPFSRVTTADSIHAEPIAPEAFTEMQDYCIRWGGEVWNHGRTHGNATGRANVYNELIAPLFELREKMPRIPIDCFAPPGGSVTFDGHMPSRTPENWYGNVVGQEVWSEHAIATGYMDHMLIRHLDGVVRDGARQWSADNFTLAFTQSIVRQLEGGGQGACLMWHMNAASDNFEAILRWIAAERDAGRLMVLTDSGLHCADSSTDYRVNLLKTHEFTGAAFTDVWTNTTGERWVERLQGYRGATVEIVCEVTGTAGQTVTTNICGVEMLHTLTGGEQTIRQVATIPVDASEIRFSCDGAVTQAHCWHV